MADRLFAQEGLVTSINRDRIANELSSRIVHCDNAVFGNETATRDDDETMYDPVFALLEQRTREAWQAGDHAWKDDIHAVLDRILSHYGYGIHSDILQRLYVKLDELWDQLENVSPAKRAARRVGQMIINFGGRIKRASEGLEKWAKTGTVDQQYGDQKYRM